VPFQTRRLVASAFKHEFALGIASKGADFSHPAV
jgi:hypothetical protein